jgi:hypothetical protein
MTASRRAASLALVCVLVSLAIAQRTARAADPTTADCLAASESSLALRNQQKLREARAQLLICSAASCPADVRDECARRVAEVNASIPTIVFEAKDTAGNDLAAVKVTMDGQPIAERLAGTALSIDPGEHTFTFETAGQTTVQRKFVIREGDKGRRERIEFGALVATSVPAAAPSPPAAGPPSILASPSNPPPPSHASSLGTQRILAIVAAGVGVVGLGVGTGYGIDAMSKHNAAHNACPSSQCSDSNGVNLWNQAVSAGNVSTAGFIIGAVGLAGGAALWFTAKPGSSESGEKRGTQVGLGPGGVQMKGVW